MERAELIALVNATGCAETVGEQVFMRDPAWNREQQSQVREQWRQNDRRPSGRTDGWLGLATGGSSGGVKLARHDERTLGAAAAGLCGFFGLTRINAIDVLPPHHVSGLMARVRCAVTGGRHRAWEWKRLEAGDLPRLSPADDGWVISLVPTQLQRLVQAPAAVEWLRALRMIFVGGGPVWPELAEAAAQAALPVALTYGMTETAAMVAVLRPGEFLAGERSGGVALPHARISVAPEGVVRIAGESIFRGYWPEWREVREFATGDLGRIDERGRLHVLGRRDAIIITGGKKVQPAEVETALRASGEVDEVAVIGLPDAEWGEVVVACYPAGGDRRPDAVRAAAALAPHQRPKRFVAVAPWPRNAQGKVNRAELRAAAAAVVGSASPG